MRLTAAEEAADPNSTLLGLSQTAKVRLENPLHAARIFAIANEVLQLEPQRLDLAIVVPDF